MDVKLQMKMRQLLSYLKGCWTLFSQRESSENTMLIRFHLRGRLNKLVSVFKNIFEDVRLGYLSPKERFVLVGVVAFITLFLAASAL